VHALVARAFLGPPPENHEVAHLDSVRSHSYLSNLKYVTKKVNASHRKLNGTNQEGEMGSAHKLTVEEVREIDFALENKTHSMRRLARMYGVSKTAIAYIRDRKNWKSLPKQSCAA
jgi:hypothetical protein